MSNRTCNACDGRGGVVLENGFASSKVLLGVLSKGTGEATREGDTHDAANEP